MITLSTFPTCGCTKAGVIWSMPDNDFNSVEKLLGKALIADSFMVRRRLRRLKKRAREGMPSETVNKQLDQFRRKLTRSATHRHQRASARPRLIYDPSLPISARKDDIIQAIKKYPVVIISGETGSGKTTQIPKFCLAAGRGVNGRIGCTQPRRIAATSVARRIAEWVTAFAEGRDCGPDHGRIHANRGILVFEKAIAHRPRCR